MARLGTLALVTAAACAAPTSGQNPTGSTGEDAESSGSPVASASASSSAGSEDGSTETGAVDGEDDSGGAGSSGVAESTGGRDTRVPMFVAQGQIGRTVISCDDGHTWVGDRDWEIEADPLICGAPSEPIRCGESACTYLSGDECLTYAECDCGHHPGFAKGVAFGDGAFVATWGWGHPGSVRRSVDGIHWEETLAGHVFGGLAYGSDRFVLSSRSPMYSSGGVRWLDGDEADFRGPDGEIVWSVRRFAYADYDGGRFVATASPPQDVLVSSDGAQSWWEPSDIPPECLTEMNTYGGIAFGNGVIVGVGLSGVACRSTDGGDTWTQTTVGGNNVQGHLLFADDTFVTWSPGVRYTSPDGEIWTATPLLPEGTGIGPAAYSEDSGTFVAVARVWDGYESQVFLRSADGVEWETLPEGAFAGGHPIFEIAFGWAEPSELCPAR